MSVADSDPEKLWLETPLLYSPFISSRLNANVYLKLENLQPSQSFKYRGVSYFVKYLLREHGPNIHLIAASGGNAGIAAACAANALHVRCTVYLPDGVPSAVIDFLKQQNAQIVSGGKYYLQARQAAEAAAKTDPDAVLVPAYDEPLLWEGHASMIVEIARQLPKGTKPDAMICSVGGGGLSGGVIQGCKSIGWDDVPFIGLEPTGSNCFYESLALNPGLFPAAPLTPPEGVRPEFVENYGVTIAHLAELRSRANCLGASSPSAGVVKLALERKGGMKSVCVPDELAIEAYLRFAEEHKLLVELACSTALVPGYRPALFDKLVPSPGSGTRRTVVFIICGGFKVESMSELKRVYDEDMKYGGKWEIACNGERWFIDKRGDA